MADTKKKSVSEGTKAPVKFESNMAVLTPPKPRPEPVMPPDPQYPPALVGAFTPSNAITSREPESFERGPTFAPPPREPVSFQRDRDPVSFTRTPPTPPEALQRLTSREAPQPEGPVPTFDPGPKVAPVQALKYHELRDLYDQMQDATSTDFNRNSGIDIRHSDESKAAAAELRAVAQRELDFVKAAQKAGKDPSQYLPMPADLLPYPNPETPQQVEVNRRAWEEEVKTAMNALQHYATLEPTDREVVRPRTKHQRKSAK